jgi:hypothetical protein
MKVDKSVRHTYPLANKDKLKLLSKTIDYCLLNFFPILLLFSLALQASAGYDLLVHEVS